MDYTSQSVQIERDIQSLRSVIPKLIEQQEHLQRQINASQLSLRKLKRYANYLHFVKLLRAPQEHFELWWLGVLMVGPLLFAGPVLIVLHACTSQLLFSLFCGLVAGIIAVWGLGKLLTTPPTASIPDRLQLALFDIEFHDVARR